MGDRLDAFYHFNSLFAFKRKFQPEWVPVYLAYPGAASLPKIGYAIVRAYLPSLSAKDVRALVARGVPRPHRSLRPTRRAAPVLLQSDPSSRPAGEPAGTDARQDEPVTSGSGR
jgi:hypothetical protein